MKPAIGNAKYTKTTTSHMPQTAVNSVGVTVSRCMTWPIPAATMALKPSVKSAYPELTDGVCPVVSARASFEPNQARLKATKEL